MVGLAGMFPCRRSRASFLRRNGAFRRPCLTCTKVMFEKAHVTFDLIAVMKAPRGSTEMMGIK